MKVELASLSFDLPSTLRAVRIAKVVVVTREDKCLCRLGLFDRLVVILQEKILGFFTSKTAKKILVSFYYFVLLIFLFFLLLLPL